LKLAFCRVNRFFSDIKAERGLLICRGRHLDRLIKPLMIQSIMGSFTVEIHYREKYGCQEKSRTTYTIGLCRRATHNGSPISVWACSAFIVQYNAWHWTDM